MWRIVWCNRKDYKIDGHFKEWQENREILVDILINLNKLDKTHLYLMERGRP